MSTLPFNHPASNHLETIHPQRLAEADGGEEEEESERGSNVNKTRNGETEKEDSKRQKGSEQQPAIGSWSVYVLDSRQ